MIVGSRRAALRAAGRGSSTLHRLLLYSTIDRFKNDTAFATAKLHTPMWGMRAGADGEAGRSTFAAATPAVRRRASAAGPQRRRHLRSYLHYTKPAAGLHFLRNEVCGLGAFDLAFRSTRGAGPSGTDAADFFRTMNGRAGRGT